MTPRRRHRWSISGSSPSWLVLSGVVMTLVLFGLVIGGALSAHRSYESIQQDELALDRLDVQLERLDQTLTVSALLAVTTADPVWRARYERSGVSLDSLIAEASAVLDTTQSRTELSAIREAHARRVSTERLALELAWSGDRTAAVNLLSGATYTNLKRLYTRSIDAALQRLNDRQERNARLLNLKLRLMAIFTGGAVLIAWLSIVGALQLNFRRRRGAELILRESEQRYRAVSDAAFDGILLSVNGILMDTSENFARMLGYDPEELRGKRAVELVAPEDRELVQRAQASGYDKPYEAECLRKDGSRFPVEICGKAVSYHGHVARVTAARDISERKVAEAEREALIHELRQKNDELERFTYTVSHDLKSPLITIKGFLKWVERDAVAGNRERMETNLKRIGDAADRMEHLMNSLLEWSRNGHKPVRRDPVLIENVAREAADMVTGRIAQRGVAVKIAPNMPVVHGDRSRLLEVMLNLLDNAIKFMGEQPHPVVEVGVRHAERDPVFYVKDNGSGIALQDKERILGLFEKLNPGSEGAGVGLALCKRIIEQHGGSLWVESDGPGKGSTFCFRLAAVPVGQTA